MDLTAIRKLVRLMQQADLSELEIDDSNQGFRVHLKRGGGQDNGGSSPVVMMPAAAPAPVAPAPPGAPAAQAPPTGEPAVEGEVIKSPMVGTFYRSASPDSDPFAENGTVVEEESVICIIEAMKVMNEIKAEMRGTVTDVLVQNGEPVEYGQPLFVIKKG